MKEVIIPIEDVSNTVFYRLRINGKRAQIVEEREQLAVNVSGVLPTPYKLLSMGNAYITDTHILLVKDEDTVDNWFSAVALTDVCHIVFETSRLLFDDFGVEMYIVCHKNQGNVLYNSNYQR